MQKVMMKSNQTRAIPGGNTNEQAEQRHSMEDVVMLCML